MGVEWHGEEEFTDSGTLFPQVGKRLGSRKPGRILCGAPLDDAGGVVCRRPAPCPDHVPDVEASTRT